MGCLLVFPYKDKLMLLPPLTYLPERVPDFYPLLREVDVPCWVWSNVRVGADMFGVGDEANGDVDAVDADGSSTQCPRISILMG